MQNNYFIDGSLPVGSENEYSAITGTSGSDEQSASSMVPSTFIMRSNAPLRSNASTMLQVKPKSSVLSIPMILKLLSIITIPYKGMR